MDLTAAARRLNVRDLLEAIVDPSKEISDQYGSVVLKRHDGSQIHGRVVNHNSGAIQVCENLLNPAAVTKVPENDIESISRSKVSLMPAGLLNSLESSEILDLLAYLKSSLNQP
jgi:putative heme-binding domain-containing protein